MSQSNIRFIGVSTSNSSIMKIFPEWSKTLGLDATISGIDIPLNSEPEVYTSALEEMVNDPGCKGALVTTHKLALYQSAHSQFSSFDEFAKTCGEISCVKIREGSVSGFAKDPISAGLAIEDFLPANFFNEDNEVILLGDGGAAIAIAWYLTNLPIPPVVIHIFGKDSSRIEHLVKVIGDKKTQLRTKISTPQALKDIAETKKKFLIINATGMGKDLPGTPWPKDLLFPKNSYLWELNYRGDLEFYHQGKAQQSSQNLEVTDGWRYFIYGWTQVISEVFDVQIDSKTLSILELQAEANR